jgi:ParB family chromosome partitioning protein
MRRESFGPDDIVIPPRLRARLDDATVAALMDSIQRIGLQMPVTVRWKDEDVILVAGRHRLEALRRLAVPLVEFNVIDGSETDARLWEIAENLHRADLTVQERAEHIAEWVRLTEEGLELKLAQVAPVSERGRVEGRGNKGGINAAVRDLGIDRTEAQRAVKIAGLSDEAKQAAVETGRDNNQTALLKAASAPQEEQARIIREYTPEPRVKPAPAPLNDIETKEQWLAAGMRWWNRGAGEWRDEFKDRIDTPVFDNTRAA